MSNSLLFWTVHVLLQIAIIIRVLLRPNRTPASRVAWVAVIGAAPIFGMATYLFFGEVSIGRKRVARLHEVVANLRARHLQITSHHEEVWAQIPSRFRSLFYLGESISGFAAVSADQSQLLEDSNQTIESMVRDMDAAAKHIHVLFYIWLTDTNGNKVAEALIRAAQRGVQCRVIVDGLGSRQLTKSTQWLAMKKAGVSLAVALPIGNVFLRPFKGRVDLRNHRKIVVIDGQITYCGSQNCADPEFRVKAKYAPWVDAVIRFTGEIALQNQFLFASDWMSQVDEDISHLLVSLPRERELNPQSFPSQVIGTGPTGRASAMPEMFTALIYAARRELIISTPYFVPNEGMHTALCAAAYRGVSTTLIVPQRNDSWLVAAASQSYYQDLLKAGVQICLFQNGLLHAKTLTVDGELSLIGSANMDRRSFDLNYENNILFFNPQLTADLRTRQQSYISQSVTVSEVSVAEWGLGRRLWNNSVGILGPII